MKRVASILSAYTNFHNMKGVVNTADARSGAGLRSSCVCVLLLFNLIFCLAVPPPVAAAEIYIVKGRDGSMTFTSRKPRSGNYQTLRSKRPAFSQFIKRRGVWRVRPIKSKWDEVIVRGAERHRLDPHLVKALVHAESGFNPKARSPKGAMGLMQLMPGTAKRFGVSDASHPELNVKGGTKYLRLLLDRYDGNETLALAAYNAGEGAVDPIKAVPPYRETQVYVRRVLKLRELYSCVDSGRKGCPTYAEIE